MTNAVTIKDVAQRADVSIGTVSRVFNNHSNVNDDIRQRVLKAALELGYSGPAGRSVASSHKNTPVLQEIGFFLYVIDNPNEGTIPPFWANILHGVEAEAGKSHIKVIYQVINGQRETPQLVLDKLHTMHLDGILLVGPADPEMVDALRALKIPLVLVDNYVRRPQLDAVLSDNFEGAMEAIEYLISEGHRRIAFSGPTTLGNHPVNALYTIEWRARGYREALLNAGLSPDDELIESSFLSPEGGYDACKRLIARGLHCSAIFCGNDSTAMGVMKALREEGLRVPEDVSVVGFDDDDMAEYLTPALTTVRVNKEVMGATAVRGLITRANNPQAISQTTTLGVELVKRDSVATLSHTPHN